MKKIFFIIVLCVLSAGCNAAEKLLIEHSSSDAKVSSLNENPKREESYESTPKKPVPPEWTFIPCRRSVKAFADCNLEFPLPVRTGDVGYGFDAESNDENYIWSNSRDENSNFKLVVVSPTPGAYGMSPDQLINCDETWSKVTCGNRRVIFSQNKNGIKVTLIEKTPIHYSSKQPWDHRVDHGYFYIIQAPKILLYAYPQIESLEDLEWIETSILNVRPIEE